MKTICHDGFVGIDVSKEWLDIVVNDNWFRIEQTRKGIDQVIAENIKPQAPQLCVLESTGGYERLIVERLQAAGLNVHIAHPFRVRTFAKAKGLLAKTDKLDAYVLSAYGHFIGSENITPLVNKEQQNLRDLQSRYAQIKEMLHAESCRFGNCISSLVKKNIQKTIKFLKIQLASVEEEIELLVEQDDDLKNRQKILRSMKGIGVRTTQALLIHLPELGLLSKKKIASLVGVAPVTNQSGKKNGVARIQKGRPSVRHVLYMAALVASRHNPIYKEFYERLTKNGKAPKVVLVAIMRKMIVTLNAMIRDNKIWKVSQ